MIGKPRQRLRRPALRDNCARALGEQLVVDEELCGAMQVGRAQARRRQAWPHHHAPGAQRVRKRTELCACLIRCRRATLATQFDAKHHIRHGIPHGFHGMRLAVSARRQVGAHDKAYLGFDGGEVDGGGREIRARCRNEELAKQRSVQAALALSADRTELVATQATQLARDQRMLLDRQMDFVHLIHACWRCRELLWAERCAVNPCLHESRSRGSRAHV
mmetsp:Transcript_44023/g.121830  ORF Transcript_44023/g.121830 Transcript_44023/m.121830 type:complete len:219 (+) Transcript_44023:385-1041(+)